MKWVERWSLDAVVVAVVWGFVLGGIVGYPMNWKTGLVLGLATWLTYVADRLRDSRGEVVTDRHLYYRIHYKTFMRIWLTCFVLSILLAVLVLPLWKVIYGWLLVAGILLYLYGVRQFSNPSGRILFKRLAVPVIFVLGVGWMAESWRAPEGWFASFVLLSGAVSNLLLISCRENKQGEEISWLFPAFVLSLCILALTGAPGVSGAILFGLLAYLRGPATTLPIRILADGVLVVMAMITVILSAGWWN